MEPWWTRTNNVLLRDGDWTIVETREEPETPGFRSSRTRYNSLVKHVCYPNGRPDGVPANTICQVVVYPDRYSTCWRCQKTVPGGMVAVWKFQNWEQLREGA